MGCGYHIGQWRYRTFSLLQKALLDSTLLECSLFIHSPKLKTTQMSIKVEGISYLWYIDTMKYYTVMRISDLQLYIILWLNLTVECWSKEARNKREHPVWFQMYKGQKQAKLIYGDGSQDSSWPGHGVVTGRAHGRCSGMQLMMCFLIWVCLVCEDSLSCTLTICAPSCMYVLYSGALANQLSRKKKRKKNPWFVVLVGNFHGVNTPIMMDFRLATNE